MPRIGIVIVLGPTASGKSALAVRLARRFKGEIISADSRQVYRELDIGTAKMTKNAMRGIAHHLLDVASPRHRFSAYQYERLAKKAVRDIAYRKHLPIICGGTGQYIAAFLGEQSFPNVPPDERLRAQLKTYSTQALFARLKKRDPRRAATIDRHNPRRLIRALEIILKTGRPVPRIRTRAPGKVLKMGLRIAPAALRKRIHARLKRDLRRGLVAEVTKLRANGLSWKRLDELGLEYRCVAQFLRGEIFSKQSLEKKLQTELWRYAKRQITWFKRDTQIQWVRNENEAIRSVEHFLGTQ